MNNANILFLLSTAISMEQTGSAGQKYWLPPNGAQWLCGTNLGPWLPPQWIGRCILGFSWAQDHVVFQFRYDSIKFTAYTSLMDQKSVFHWSHYLAAISVPLVGLEDVTTQIKAFTKFTQQALNDSNQAMSLLNYEICMMKKSSIIKHMALNIFSISKAGCNSNWVLPPYTDESSNITHLMTHMKNLKFLP